VLVDCFDQNRIGGMRHTPYKLSLFIDDTLYYEVVMDTLDFEVQRSVNLEYDYVEAVDGEKRVRRLFHRTGNEFAGSKPVYNHRGLFGIDTTQTFGLHRAQVVAQDGAGNTSRLTFDFGWEPPDSTPFVASDRNAKNVSADASLRYSVVDDGLIVAIDNYDGGAENPRIELYLGDSLLGVEYPGKSKTRSYFCFIPPQEKYRHIDRIGLSLSDTTPAQHFEPANLYLIGAGDNESIDTDGRFFVKTSRQNFFAPRFIDVQRVKDKPDLFVVEPEAFVCRSDFEVSMFPGATSAQKGICWWDKKKNEWVWVGNALDGQNLITSAGGGGKYTVLTDSEPPTISRISVTNGLTYFNPQLSIDFLLSDNLSGIEDDLNISIELDGNWMIPEYDPDIEVFKTKPVEPLADGRHELRIAATDNAGNKTVKELHFFVKAQKKN
jgi:hypothetical protein